MRNYPSTLGGVRFVFYEYLYRYMTDALDRIE